MAWENRFPGARERSRTAMHSFQMENPSPTDGREGLEIPTGQDSWTPGSLDPDPRPGVLPPESVSLWPPAVHPGLCRLPCCTHGDCPQMRRACGETPGNRRNSRTLPSAGSPETGAGMLEVDGSDPGPECSSCVTRGSTLAIWSLGFLFVKAGMSTFASGL